MSLLSVYSQQAVSSKAVSVAPPRDFVNGISVHPFYLYNSGIRVDYDRMLSDYDGIIVGLTYYESRGDDEFFNDVMLGTWYNTDRVYGGSLELGYKYFPFETDIFYISGSLAYWHFGVSYKDYVFVSYVEDGLTKQYPSWESQRANFDRLEAVGRAVIQTPLRRRLFADFSLGLGYRYGFYDAAKPYAADHAFNLGYRGITFPASFRVGVRF
jgi:hypothetical protein